MSEILFLAHRIPYPPDKGDKIRSYHLLRALAAQHEVHLGTFVDDPADWAHVETVRRLCRETCIRPLSTRNARLRSAGGLLTGEPLTMAYYRDRALRGWVQCLAARRPLDGVLAFSSSMGQYAEGLRLRRGAVRVMDFCDVDSDKWRQYAESHSLPMRLVYQREARTLARTEARYVREFDASVVISDAEAGILRDQAGGSRDRILVAPNGVDTDYFDPAASFANPFAPGMRPVVFTGAMDYQANVDGVQWFARDVLPEIRRRLPDVVFVIVGSNPAPEVLGLVGQVGVVVTGRVPDVRPYLAHAEVVVAPLRVARGVQNKVLEAMAMARPVVATENAVQGIPQAAGAGVHVTSDPTLMARFVVDCATNGDDGTRARQFVLERYVWQRNLARVSALFEPGRPSVQCPVVASAGTA